MKAIPLPSQPRRMPIKCALCQMAYFTLMKPGSIREMTGCSSVQTMQCLNNPNNAYIIDACLDGRIRFHINDEPLSNDAGAL